MSFERAGRARIGTGLRGDLHQRRVDRRRPVRAGCDRAVGVPVRSRARSSPRRPAARAGLRARRDQVRVGPHQQPAEPARGAQQLRLQRHRMGPVLPPVHRRRQRRHRGEDRQDPDRPRSGAQARRRHQQERVPARQGPRAQQPTASDQPVRDRPGRGRGQVQPLRRYGPGQRPADGAHRAEASRGRHPRGVPPDRPLPARLVLGRVGPVRVRAAVRHQQRHADQVLLQHHPCRAPRRSVQQPTRQADHVEQLRVHVMVGRRGEPSDHRPDRVHLDVLRQAHASEPADPVLRLRRRSPSCS